MAMNIARVATVAAAGCYALLGAGAACWLGEVAAVPRKVEGAAFGLFLIAWVALPVLIAACAVLLIWRRTRRPALEAGVVAALLLAFGPLIMRVGWTLRHDWLGRVAAEADGVVVALHALHSRNAATSATVAEAIESHPVPALRGRSLRYERQSDGSWRLYLTAATLFGATDEFEYNSEGRYPEGRPGVERIGNWAYYYGAD